MIKHIVKHVDKQKGKGDFNLIFPIWVYFVIVGVFISAIMAIKTAKEDRVLETEWIEKEGEVYLERMEKEKERRRGTLSS